MLVRHVLYFLCFDSNMSDSGSESDTASSASELSEFSESELLDNDQNSSESGEDFEPRFPWFRVHGEIDRDDPCPFMEAVRAKAYPHPDSPPYLSYIFA